EVRFGPALFVDQVLQEHLAVRRGVELRQNFRQVSGKGGFEFVVRPRERPRLVGCQVAGEPALIERMGKETPAGDHCVDLGNYVLSYHTLLLAERADSTRTDGAYQTEGAAP